MPETAVASHIEVAHRLRGRTHLRVARGYRDTGTIARLQQTLQQVPGVRRVEANASAGSVVIYHDAEHTRVEDVADSLAESLGFILSLVPPRGRARVATEASTLAAAVRARFGRLDASVSRATDGWVDRKMLVPLAFLGAAVLQVALTEGAWTAVPPYVLLYYAFDTYMKFHYLAPHTRTGERAVQAAAPAASGIAV